MKEYIEREALIKYADKWLFRYCKYDFPVAEGIIRAFRDSVINHLPAADVVEVVRCKDCVSSRPINKEYWVENAFYEECVWCQWFDTGMLPDEYCSHGKRKEK